MSKENNEKKSSAKQLLAGGLLIISTVCLTASAVYLYDTYQESKTKVDTYVNSVQDAVVEGGSGESSTKVDSSEQPISKDMEPNQTNQESNQQEETKHQQDGETSVADNNQELQGSQSADGEDTGNTELEQIVADSNPIDEVIHTKSTPPCKVKGIYVSGPMAGSTNNMANLIDLVESTELNTMVIDIKNDSGEITYKMDNEVAKEINATVNYITNIQELVTKLKEKGVYLIARVVAFKDPILAKNKPELSLKNANGTIFRDKAGLAWVNPYKKEVWEYLVSVAKDAANIGFDEVQFDYIRFSTDSGMKQVDFGEEAKDKTKIEAITDFTKYAYEELSPLGVYVSADVYGTIINSEIDAKIVGQSYVEMSKYLDYICPMIYPSHYANGSYGIDYPDLEPYYLIKKVLEESKMVLKVNDEVEHQAIVRPWLQDFTATWVEKHQKYDAKEIKEQIQGVYDSGYEEWILWNGSNRYTSGGLLDNKQE